VQRAIVADLKARPAEYGEGAVAVALGVLGQDESNLYRHARVAERWSDAEYDALLARRTTSGKPLSWSHLVLLAGVEPRAAGERMIERALERSWTVRQLGRALEQEGLGEDQHGPSSR